MAFTPTTWDPETAEFYAVLSGGGLVYSTNNYYANSVTTVAGVASGAWYWEIQLDSYAPGSAFNLGACAGTRDTGMVRQQKLGYPVEGDVLGIALDVDAEALLFFKNGVLIYTIHNADLDEGDVWRPRMSLAARDLSSGVIATANFGASPFVYPAPVGFHAGFGEDAPFFGAASAATMLSAPSAFALQQLAWGASPGPLGVASARATHDFTGVIGEASTRYVADLVTPTGAVRIPISSWQATLQTGSSNYVQCVIPACDVWQEAINAATEFVIYRRAVLPSGAAIEYEMARAPAGQLQFDRGPQRHTCTVSGYSDAFAGSVDPPAAYDRALTGVRSISSGSSYRVRCAVDWLLRPGHRAYVSGAPFVVKFINYYAPSEWDCYMDVGG